MYIYIIPIIPNIPNIPIIPIILIIPIIQGLSRGSPCVALGALQGRGAAQALEAIKLLGSSSY